MNKELFVSSTPHETKVAVTEDDQLAEIYFERDNEYTLAGSIYKGRVTRVLPGMQSAFVDIGLERDAFLYVTDFLEESDESEEFDAIAVPAPRGEQPREARSQRDFARAAASEAEIQPHLIQPEPAFEAGEEELEGEGAAEAGGEEPQGGEAGGEEGVRRWRGRRRRGRGRRGRGSEARPNGSGEAEPAAREVNAESDADSDADESESFAEPESGSPESAETEDAGAPESSDVSRSSPSAWGSSAEPGEASEREPRGRRDFRGGRDRDRDRDRGRGGRDFREGREGRESFGPPAGVQPIVLPGESIAKYGRSEQQPESGEGRGSASSAQRESSAAPAIPSFLRRRPSTEVEDITQVREVRARDRGEGRREDRGAQAPTRGEGAVEAGARSEEESVGAVSGAEPAVEADAGRGPAVPGDTSDHDMFAGEAPASHKSEEASRFDRMNVASVFGGDAAETAEEEQTEAESAPEFAGRDEGTRHAAPRFSNAAPEVIVGESPAPAAQEDAQRDATAPRDFAQRHDFSHEPEVVHEEVEELPERGAPGGTVIGSEDGVGASGGATAAEPERFAPGEGHVEEEEIFEDEHEFAAHTAAAEEDEFEELEEEVLDRIAADQHQTRVQQLAEAVEETGIEHAAMAGEEEHAAEFVLADEAEGGDESGEEEEFAEEEVANGEGRAEMRAPAGTANFPQQRTERPQFDRRRRERGGRRGGGDRTRRGAPGGGGARREPHRTTLISELLKEGQEILVQIAKEPIGKKGARITSHIALPGRFLVYMPTVNHIGVSRKISSEEERQRLKRIVISERENGHGGFIVRTAADRAPEDELRADIRFLKNLWHEIKARADAGKAPALIYHDLNLVERILRDQVNENFTAIWVDTEQDYERMLRFVNRFQPALVKRVKLWTKETPLFEQFNIQDEINKALKSKVWLKSGGYIVINQTEALVAIDVNTGKYVGKTSRLEDTIVKTNVDAIKEIVRQVRLRDLGGIIVIDFIDMDERRNRQKVMQALEEALRSDRAPSKVLQFNDFGLVAITRKRVKQSLERTLGSSCSYCSGTGFTKAVTTVCNEIWVEMKKMAKHFDHPDIMLRVNPEVAKALKANAGRWIQEIEELTKRNLIVKTDALLHQEQFDIN